MSSDPNVPNNLSFSTRCLPGSVAEQIEQDRMVEFQRTKALRKEEELKNRPLQEAERERKHLLAVKALEERKRQDRSRNSNR